MTDMMIIPRNAMSPLVVDVHIFACLRKDENGAIKQILIEGCLQDGT